MKRFFASVLLSSLLATAAVAQTPSAADSTKLANRRAHWLCNATDDLTVSVGFNTLTGSQAPTLRPLGSRYVSVGYLTRLRISQGSKAALALRTGIEVSWYNFMLDENRVATQTPTGVAFPESGRKLDKSKLTAAYLNLPVMPTMVFRRGVIQSVSAGGYVGMRLDSYTKVKEETGAKDRTHGNYSLNNLRYGIAAEVDFRQAPTFFAQYDLNPLFRANQGPGGQVLSFGIRL